VNIIVKPCAPGNYAHGRGNKYKPMAIVLHLMDGTLAGTDAWFANPDAKVSAHYGIGKDGKIHQYVKEEDTAFHAGRVADSIWLPAMLGVNPNVFTIGVEHEGRPEDKVSDAMVTASAQLVAEICKRWGIPIDRSRIVGHREIYAAKSCPGPDFPIGVIVELAKRVSIGQGEATT
jgi:N-acetylmuramoyl-L-alanine amidase